MDVVKACALPLNTPIPLALTPMGEPPVLKNTIEDVIELNSRLLDNKDNFLRRFIARLQWMRRYTLPKRFNRTF